MRFNLLNWVFCLLLCNLAQATTPVSTLVLSEVLTAQTHNAPAQVKPLNRPKLAAEISGQIRQLPVQVGGQVQAGDLLVELDCRAHQARAEAVIAAIKRANAQLTFAKTQYTRARNLKRKGSVSNEVLEQRRLAVKTAQADLQAQRVQQRLTKLNVQHCQVKAPFAALLSQRLGSVGGFANPGTPLVELVQLDQLEVSADLREDQAGMLDDAQNLRFQYQGQDYPLQLRAVLPLVDERNRTQEARLTFVGGVTAAVGAAGRLVWQGSQALLPADYMLRRADQMGIFIAQAGQAVFVPLVQAREGQPAQVNLPADTLLIVEGRQRLQHGDPVRMNP
jgi:RND family efflux transporter MFP subunit